MKEGLLLRLRVWRRAIARTLAVALVLPALLSLVPETPLSPSAALAQAITQSVCDATGQKAPGKGPGYHDQSCVLCAAGCSMGHMAALPAGPIAAPWRALHAKPLIPTRIAVSVRAPWRSVVVPRGPPAV